MLRNVNAPPRAFTQIPHTIVRHPRLSPAAKTLLTWQLSLTADDRQCLSETARRAGIRKTAFQRAKRELLDEGYVHEWRVRVESGRFRTVQLVSNVVLTPAEALALRDGREHGAEPSPPGAGSPTVGEPTGRTDGRQPRKNIRENTTRPTEQASGEEASGAREPGRRRRAAAEAFLRTLVFADRRLAMPARVIRDLAPLLVPWLQSDLSAEEIRRTLTGGLGGDVRSPVGVLRWRLRHALPDVPPAVPAAPRPEPRVARMRECRGEHTQSLLFTPRPGVEGDLCPECRAEGAAVPDLPPEPERVGFELFRASRRPRADRPARAEEPATPGPRR
ncbi:hypothetical protein RM572_08930 [Streptomyces sp. DSM 42041]|uniref:MarR family transcriptional regulator n=1 Tax=Streptomyces hazeniae TaxID=3075538 RepID=A0ABU2NQ39_9ACTN|nr:hypothetical protein [Streptomyces sp. DSM 42041]MDT0378895.1 hypothetical protein [Streptomyces sp. DSM 42041]